ncbi:MAG TPA: hypothetical protein VKP66_08080 [Steroidobacteraceae bacterium]|nr:hypothetical protein [Steroidobacteraceae bacterium]
MNRAASRLALWTTVAAGLSAMAGCAGDPPKLKEGLWDIRGQRVESPGNKRSDFTYKLCRDHAFDRAADATLRNVKECNTVLKKLGDGKYSSSSRCQADGVTIDSIGTSSYTGSESIHSDTRATYTPAFDGRTEETLTEDQKYIGKCPPAMKPGDRLNPDGILWRHDRQ